MFYFWHWTWHWTLKLCNMSNLCRVCRGCFSLRRFGPIQMLLWSSDGVNGSMGHCQFPVSFTSSCLFPSVEHIFIHLRVMLMWCLLFYVPFHVEMVKISHPWEGNVRSYYIRYHYIISWYFININALKTVRATGQQHSNTKNTHAFPKSIVS